MEYLPAKHLLHRSRDTRWFGTDHTMNIYRGCCHGCLYLSLIHISEPTRP